MKLSRTVVAKLDVAAVQSSAGLRCSKVNCRTTRAWRGTATQRPEGGISNVRGDWRAGDPMQRAGVLRGAPEAAGQLGPVLGASGAADGWRLEVAHVERGQTGLPKQIGGGENKARAGSAQALDGQHARVRAQVGVRGAEDRLQQTSRSARGAEEGEGEATVVGDR